MEPPPPARLESRTFAGRPTLVEGDFRRDERVEVVEASPAEGPRTGVIRGDVTMEARAAQELRSITIKVSEAMRDDGDTRPRFTRLHGVRIDPTQGTPTFHITGVPFSDFGYVVQAIVPGFNGTEQTVHLNERSPVADVVLGVHPGTPFSILLRDQDLNPLAGVEVNMTPEGPPEGRQVHYKRTDSFGAAVFENVLRGAYTVYIGGAEPLLPPQTVEVFASSGTQAQSKTIIVPKGETLTVNLFSPTGHGIAGVEVKLSSGSGTLYREMKQVTDWSGRATFQHLVPGSYWVNVIDPRYEPRTLPATVRAGEKPKDVNVRLVMR
ncbi:MAG TPA: carboxypeptidase-like regulatory domain-containing protein [Planctomycetota bacterium]|nr:carboxypeptidase-like regulatory domain-containing protein [Planctomycetota bacterium]